MRALLWRYFTLRHARHAPGSTFTLILLLALGVGVLFSVRLANRAALDGFRQFTGLLTGGSDFILTPSAGFMESSMLPELRKRLDPEPVGIVPILEIPASYPSRELSAIDTDDEGLVLIGLDLLAMQNFREWRPRSDMRLELPGDTTPELNDPRLVWAPADLMEQQGWSTNDPIAVQVGERVVDLNIGGMLPDGAWRSSTPQNMLLMDLPALQALVGKGGILSRVELVIPEGPQQSNIRARLAERLSPSPTDGWRVEEPEDAARTARNMTAAFRLNLSVLSGLALLVGVYLILQALEAAVVRRRREIGILRSMGVSARDIRRAWWAESLSLGVMGSGLGVLLGWAGAQLAVGGVARTINALYVSTATEAAGWDHREALMAFSLGVLASGLAGWLPSRDAARVPPIQAIAPAERGGGLRLLNHPLLGLVWLGMGAVLVLLPPIEPTPGVRFPLAGYAAALCLLVGISTLAVTGFPLLRKALMAGDPQSATWRYTLSQFRRPTGRHKLALAGLVVAVGMASGMDLLIHSFTRTMHTWVDVTLKADLFVSVKGLRNARTLQTMQPDTWRTLSSHPAIARADVGHIHPIELDQLPTTLVGMRSTDATVGRGFLWLHQPAESEHLGDLQNGIPSAFAGEPFAERFNKRAGDLVLLPTPSGPQQVRITGIFHEYGNERGSLIVDGATVCRWFGDESAVNLALWLRPGAAADALSQEWSDQYPGLAIRPNSLLRSEIMRVFQQTFGITHALRIIGLVVALGGLALAMLGMLLDRSRELRVLGELGMPRRNVIAAVAAESGLLAFLGAAFGLLLSLGLGAILVFVINKQSFGWTLAWGLPLPGMLGLAIGLIVVGGVVGATVAARETRPLTRKVS